jgi:hypothetical protein
MKNNIQAVKLLTKVIFSIGFFALGIVLLYSGDPVKQSLGAGFLGTVIGYWIK